MATRQIEALREMAAAADLQVRAPPAAGLLGGLAFRLWRRRLLTEHGAFLPGSAVHEAGGAAMGADPRESVLNEFGQCWDAENVFVADGASFTSGGWQNVTLTIMALAVRACEHIVTQHRAGRI
jgi:choline dehydrogenase-like flavoprotein